MRTTQKNNCHGCGQNGMAHVYLKEAVDACVRMARKEMCFSFLKKIKK